jgi:hypothetical protein
LNSKLILVLSATFTLPGAGNMALTIGGVWSMGPPEGAPVWAQESMRATIKARARVRQFFMVVLLYIMNVRGQKRCAKEHVDAVQRKAAPVLSAPKTVKYIQLRQRIPLGGALHHS